MATKFTWTGKDGVFAKAAHSFTPSFLNKLHGHIQTQESHKRVGMYSTVSGITFDGKYELIAAKTYSDPCPKTPKDSEFFEMSKNDRLGQLKSVENYLNLIGNHPLDSEIRIEIETERQYWKEESAK